MNMKIREPNANLFQKVFLILGILAGLSLFGYASVNLIRMPSVSPDAFVPKELVQSSGSLFGLFQFIFVLGFSFAFLPVSVMFTIKRYSDNPYAMIFGGCLLCLALIICAVIYWNSKRILGYLIIGSVITFTASVPFLWINGNVAVVGGLPLQCG